MLLSDFTSEGFYYNRGQDLLQPGDVIETPDQKYYKIFLTNQGEVWAEEGDTHELKDPQDLGRDVFRDCYPPLEPARVPQFSY